MMDGSRDAFAMGIITGGSIMIAVATVLFLILVPWPGGTDWGAFVRGALTAPIVVLAVLVLIPLVIWVLR